MLLKQKFPTKLLKFSENEYKNEYMVVPGDEIFETVDRANIW